MATKKTATQPKKAVVKKTLAKRVNISGSKALNRDVRMPKWLKAIGGYFKGAYQELTQVQWPGRKATWGFTIAVIVFTLALSGLILGLDYVFEQLFKQVIL